jgi:hypothetical protein
MCVCESIFGVVETYLHVILPLVRNETVSNVVRPQGTVRHFKQGISIHATVV